MLNHYYENPAVRARLLEYLGGTCGEDITARYIALNAVAAGYPSRPIPAAQLWSALSPTEEVARSLWDRRGLLAHLDLEYVNFDFPGEPYDQVARSFAAQAAVVRAVREQLCQHGIAPLHLLSGRGHHWVWQMDLATPVVDDLAHLGRLPSTLVHRYGPSDGPDQHGVGRHTGAAFGGLALVMEYVAVEALRAAQEQSEVPVTITAVETVSKGGRRECVALDLSEYGDPLDTRTVRMPFSVYLKRQAYGRELNGERVSDLSPLFLIPLCEMGEQEALLTMRDAGAVTDLAHVASVQIPDQTLGMGRLVAAYRQSPLAKVHGWFYAQEQHDSSAWPATYDLTPWDILPASGRRILQHPNELLLKPSCIRHLTRLLLALGWHPRHIAGLVRSKYERDYGWGDQWYQFDAACRADFYCRTFTSALLSGVDPPDDFTSPPVGMEDLRTPEALAALEPYRQSLCHRLDHDQLAHRPFNRLLL